MSKCAVVTGAASGIGKAVSQAFAKENYNVVVADTNQADGAALADSINGFFVKADLSEREPCRLLIDTAAKKYGGVDILINNAGFQHVSPIVEFPEDVWDKMLRLMLTAPFLLTKYAWPYMQKNQWGRVVNIASIHAKVASLNKVGYTSAKHGLIGLTRTAALEGGEHGITANAICPAYVRTPLVENQIQDQARANKINENEVLDKVLLKSAAIKRLIEPDEIASLVLYLCSDKANSVTGASWTIDGGWTSQ